MSPFLLVKNVKDSFIIQDETSRRYCSHCCLPVAMKDSVLDPPVHHISAEHRVVVGVGVLLPLALGHGLPAVVEHVF